MKKTYFYLLTLIIISSILLFPACSTVEDIFGGDEDEEEFSVMPEKYFVNPYEVSMLEISGADITPGNYDGYIGDNIYVELSVMDNKVYFFTPEMVPGTHTLSAYIDGYDFNIDIDINSTSIIPDPEETLSNSKQRSEAIIKSGLALDSILFEAGMISEEQLYANKLKSQNRLNQINEWLSGLTAEQIDAYAKVYTANKDWINEFQELVSSNFKSDVCDSHLNNGIDANNNGRKYEANFHFLKYKQCEIQNSSTYKLSQFIDKINTLLKQDPNGEKSTLAADVDPATGIVAFLLGAVILYTQWELITAEFNSWRERVLPENILEDKSSNNFTNGQKKNFNQKVKFRAVDFSDSNDEGIIGSFVNMIKKANDAIKRLLSVKSDLDIKEFDLPSSSTSMDFNRNMSIDPSSISNSNVVLKSSSIVNDNWEVTFETSENEPQDFTFNLIYNDNFGQEIVKNVNAKLTIGDPLLGTWEAFEVDGEPVGEWKYYYFSGNCTHLVGWASITHKATLTLDGSNIIFYYDGSDREYQYTDLDYNTCSYSSLDINESSDDDSYTSTYLHEGNKIIVQTVDGPFPMTYQLTDQNNTLIVNADGEINKYNRVK